MWAVKEIYYGVPRYAGEVYRATRAPTLLFVFCIFGLPLLLSTGTTIYMYATHSMTPFKILAIGMIEQRLALEANAKAHNEPLTPIPLSPKETRLLQEATPLQKALAVQVMNFSVLDACVAIGALIWWGIRHRRFTKQRKAARSRSQATGN